MKKKTLLASAAISGLLMTASLGAHAEGGHNHGKSAKGMGQCHGVNSCKGHGDCAGKGYSCAGKNSCKGKGWKKMTQKECKEKGGKFKGDHS